MKKEEKKKEVKKSSKVEVSSTAKIVNIIALCVGIVLVGIGIFVDSVAMWFKLIGCLIILISGIAFSIRSGKHVLVKSVIITCFIAVLFTWLFPYGAFSGATFTNYEMNRVGLTDIPTIVYYAIYFVLDKLMYLLAVAGFYGILSVTDGYKKIISGIAKKLEKNKTVFAIVSLVIFVVLTAFISNTLIVFFFVPFFLSILSKLKVDKLTAFIVTFGGILTGILGAPFGTEGLHWFNYYVGTSVKDGLTLRLIIEACSLVVFAILAVIRIKKADKKSEKLETINDVFEVSEPSNKKTKTVPTLILLIITTILVLLGSINWAESFNIDVFTKFHTWLTGLKIGSSPVISYVFGNSAEVLGSFTIATYAIVLVIMSIIIALVSRISVSEFLTEFGIKKMGKAIIFFAAAFTIFVVMYITPIIPTITNWLYGLTNTFNPFITTIGGLIASIFHSDFGYTGYSVGSYLVASYPEKISIIHTIYFTTFGFIQFLLPSSGLLLLGLSLTDVSYKSWLKYIWKFIVIMLIIFMIIILIAAGK